MPTYISHQFLSSTYPGKCQATVFLPLVWISGGIWFAKNLQLVRNNPILCHKRFCFMDNVTFHFHEMLYKKCHGCLTSITFCAFADLVRLCWEIEGAGIFIYFCIYLLLLFCSAKLYLLSMNERETAMSQQQGQDPWLPLHLTMVLIWCVTRWCTVDNYLSTAALRRKALSLFPTHMRSETHIKKALCHSSCHLPRPLGPASNLLSTKPG